MKRTGLCDRPPGVRGARRAVPGARSGAGSRARGFTLIELMIAIAILAVIAILSWRGLDQIIRGRQAITATMADERVFAQTFDQMRSDARDATSDDEAGSSAVALGDNTLQIVRRLVLPGAAPRLQVVRYRIVGGRIVRYASPPLANVGELRRATGGDITSEWNAVSLMGGVVSINARLFVPRFGWTTQMQVVHDALAANLNALKVPQLGNAPMPRAVAGIEVSIGVASLARPIVRVFLVGD